MTDHPTPNPGPPVDDDIHPDKLFDIRLRAVTIEHFAWTGYLHTFTDMILEHAGLPAGLADPGTEMAGEAARCADALMRERQKRFPRADHVQQVFSTHH